MNLTIDENYLKELKKLQSLELKIAKEIKRVCENNNIHYFLIGGTLLGAIRHNGFIPWDDDIDIGMKREDYESFLQVCKNDLGNEFFLQTYKTDRAYGQFFAKVRLKETQFIEKSAEKTSAHNGIYVDIFPFDFTDEDAFIRSKYISRINLLTNLYRFKKGYKTWTNDFLHMCYYYLYKFLTYFIKISLLESSVERIISLSKNSDYPYVINYFDCTPSKEYMSIKGVNNLIDVSFEDTVFKAPLDSKEYLFKTYGNYMQLPPKDKRYNRHNIVKLDFGKYAE